MKMTSSHPFGALIVGAFSLNASQAATVLTGSGLATNAAIPANHGSALAGTPDVNLNWSATVGSSVTSVGWEAYNSWPNGGTGGQVYQLNGPNPWTGQTYSIAFTPSGGTIAIALTSVTLNDWTGAGSTTLNWSISGPSSGTLASGTGLVVTDATFPTLNFGVQGLGGEVLTLTFAPTAGSGSYFAIDNLSFDQVSVPEASSALLSGLALGALAMRRRRA